MQNIFKKVKETPKATDFKGKYFQQQLPIF